MNAQVPPSGLLRTGGVPEAISAISAERQPLWPPTPGTPSCSCNPGRWDGDGMTIYIDYMDAGYYLLDPVPSRRSAGPLHRYVSGCIRNTRRSPCERYTVQRVLRVSILGGQGPCVGPLKTRAERAALRHGASSGRLFFGTAEADTEPAHPALIYVDLDQANPCKFGKDQGLRATSRAR